MAILNDLGIETEAVYHNARPGTLYDEAPGQPGTSSLGCQGTVRFGVPLDSCCVALVALAITCLEHLAHFLRVSGA